MQICEWDSLALTKAVNKDEDLWVRKGHLQKMIIIKQQASWDSNPLCFAFVSGSIGKCLAFVSATYLAFVSEETLHLI